MVGTGTGAIPVTLPTGGVTISGGPEVGLGNLGLGVGAHWGIWQHSGSLGSATRVQLAGMLSYLAHLRQRAAHVTVTAGWGTLTFQAK